MRVQRGFSLIELIIIIAVLGSLSVGMFGFVQTSVDGYSDSRDRQQLQSQARFVVERLARELRQAVPNSVAVLNPIAGEKTGRCLVYTPIKYAGIYTALIEGQSTLQASLSTTLNWKAPTAPTGVIGDSVIFNPLKRSDFDAASSTNSFKISAVDNTGLLTLSKLPTALWPSVNPSNRLYIYNQSVSFCFEFATENTKNGQLIRRVLGGASPNNAGQVLAKNLLAGSQFRILDTLLAQANLINVDYRFAQNNEISVYNQQIQVTNVP